MTLPSKSVLTMNYTIAQTLSPKHFKRRFGVQRSTFRQIVNTLTPLWRPVPELGAKPKLGIEARVLVALEYWREYRTYLLPHWQQLRKIDHPCSTTLVLNPISAALTNFVGDRIHISTRFNICNLSIWLLFSYSSFRQINNSLPAQIQFLTDLHEIKAIHRLPCKEFGDRLTANT
ncbi:hypothetical protein H6F90_03260 [Trichocoleus sp. FACHB-591]|uniref:hypothetical protein n=1 Tax=Trichocoleus sp. FACHB-591 TaxID=2692872 RepID=UPI0016885BA4|nr:hypothetical protein [Trichocoleus sp. FACHB-591]MBD2094170.1 hypothetical protein [Trichocoleus sp. FACHB-591]